MLLSFCVVCHVIRQGVIQSDDDSRITNIMLRNFLKRSPIVPIHKKRTTPPKTYSFLSRPVSGISRTCSIIPRLQSKATPTPTQSYTSLPESTFNSLSKPFWLDLFKLLMRIKPPFNPSTAEELEWQKGHYEIG